MNEILLKAKERKRLRKLNLRFDQHIEKFIKEYEVSEEEEWYLLKEFFLKDLIQHIDRKLLNSYEEKRDIS